MSEFYMLTDVPAKQFSFNGYPAVRIFSTQPSRTSKCQFKLNDEWVAWIKAMNTPKANQYLFQPTAGVMFATWIETVISFVRGKKHVTRVVMPKYQSEGFFTNRVTAELVGDWYRIKTLDFKAGPPDPFKFNYETTPDLVHLFTVERHDGTIVNPPTFGEPVYVPLISMVPVYVEAKYLRPIA